MITCPINHVIILRHTNYVIAVQFITRRLAINGFSKPSKN
jgi:hypothetical protein